MKTAAKFGIIFGSFAALAVAGALKADARLPFKSQKEIVGKAPEARWLAKSPKPEFGGIRYRLKDSWIGFGLGLYARGGGGSAQPGAMTDRLAGETFDLVLSPSAIVEAWYTAGNPTVKVEKGYGSGVYQDLYAHTDGYLYTSRWGGGDRADTWAAGENLLVEIPYNQAAADTSTDQPTKISDDLRVLLNLDVPNAPYFAGYSQGTQDASQHATQRGYDLGFITALKTNLTLFNAVAVYEHNASANDVYILQDDVAGTTRFWRLDAGNKRHYPNWDLVVGNERKAQGTPDVYQVWSRNDYFGVSTKHSTVAGVNGVFQDGNNFAANATAYTFNAMGPVNSIRGKLYALCIANNAVADEMPFTSMGFDGIPTLLAPTFSNDITTDNPSIAYPVTNAVIQMDMATETADIPIWLFGKPNTEYVADWNLSGYLSIGTTDANGVLKGALAGRSKGNATLSVKESGGTTPITVANVAVGYVMYVMGESGADGRGTNVTITIPSGSLRKQYANWTTASNEWWKLYCQYIYDTYACVVHVLKVTLGGSYFYRGDTLAEGSWSVDAPSTAGTAKSSEGRYGALIMAPYITQPHLWLWDIGKNDASLTTTGAEFLSRFVALRDNYRTTLGNSNLAFHCIASGDNGAVSDALTDEVRLNGQIAGWDAGSFLAAGSFAHLEGDLDGVHFDTGTQKQKAVDIVVRHVFGSGRAPQLSSSSYSGSDVIINLTGGVSPMTISAGSDVTGWTVTDNNGARTVSNVAISTMQLTLTCDQALAVPITVQWASGDSSIGTTLLDSDGTTPLPPEPFATTISS